MRIYLFILLAVLAGSCSTTKEYDCDYSDYKTISLEDFEWVKEVENIGSFIIRNDSVFYYYPHSWRMIASKGSNISRIDVSNGDFLDTIEIDYLKSLYVERYPSDKVSCGGKVFMKSSRKACINQVNLLIDRPVSYWEYNKKQIFSIEIVGARINGILNFNNYKFKLNNNEFYRLNDIALYKGCYLILSFEVTKLIKEKPVHCIGLLDLKKLIDNY